MFNKRVEGVPNKSVRFAAALALFGLFSCVPDGGLPNDPKKVLNAYISKSFSIRAPSERAELIGFLTRDARGRLSAWSDDQFSQAFIQNRREFLKLVFAESKSVSPTEMNITYELTYLDQSKGDGHAGAKITQKKMAQLIQDQGKWLIADVQNLKELVEYKNEMALP